MGGDRGEVGKGLRWEIPEFRERKREGGRRKRWWMLFREQRTEERLAERNCNQ